MNIQLHQWEISPFCRKIRKILAMKGLEYEKINYNGLEARKAAKLTPVGKLPVLKMDDTIIQDSHDIALWLDQRFPDPPLFPADPREKSRVRIWEDWADESLYWYEVYFRFNYPEALNKSVELLCEGRPAWEKPLMKLVSRIKMRGAVKSQGLGRIPAPRVEARFCHILESLETLLTAGSWLVGARRSLADIAVASQLDEMLRTSHLKETILGYRHLATWLEANHK